MTLRSARRSRRGSVNIPITNSNTAFKGFLAQPEHRDDSWHPGSKPGVAGYLGKPLNPFGVSLGEGRERANPVAWSFEERLCFRNFGELISGIKVCSGWKRQNDQSLPQGPGAAPCSSMSQQDSGKWLHAPQSGHLHPSKAQLPLPTTGRPCLSPKASLQDWGHPWEYHCPRGLQHRPQ